MRESRSNAVEHGLKILSVALIGLAVQMNGCTAGQIVPATTSPRDEQAAAKPQPSAHADAPTRTAPAAPGISSKRRTAPPAKTRKTRASRPPAAMSAPAASPAPAVQPESTPPSPASRIGMWAAMGVAGLILLILLVLVLKRRKPDVRTE